MGIFYEVLGNQYTFSICWPFCIIILNLHVHVVEECMFTCACLVPRGRLHTLLLTKRNYVNLICFMDMRQHNVHDYTCDIQPSTFELCSKWVLYGGAIKAMIQ